MKKPASLLIVEDEEKMRELLQKILTTDGYRVKTASNGSEALAMIEETPFDIVLSDVKMPGLNGIELLKAVKKITAETYVVIMTAFGTIDSAVEAMKQGAFDYVSKPFKMDEIRILMNKIMEEKALREEVISLRKI
jgi:DNA-binding NtrC family response regulator